MKKQYSIYNENFEITHSALLDEGTQPENSTLKFASGQIKPMYDKETDTIYEGATNNEIITVEVSIAAENEFQSYLKRKADGENAYLKLSAEFRLAKLYGQISEETHSYLEELLTPVRNEVMFGQWKKGLSILESLGVAQIGEDLYNRLHLQISEYILNNY